MRSDLLQLLAAAGALALAADSAAGAQEGARPAARLVQEWSGGRCTGRVPDSEMVRDFAKWRWLWRELGRGKAPAEDFGSRFAVAVVFGDHSLDGSTADWPGIDGSNGGYLVHYRVRKAKAREKTAPCLYFIRLYEAPGVMDLAPLKVQIVRDRDR
ncbi:MAG: hypothetical protein HY077_12795 [Elusimicrobia bacterium]|nr:hypothetical protein [Elusimicrobiota bacterium]